jgi:hypothetical protein
MSRYYICSPYLSLCGCYLYIENLTFKEIVLIFLSQDYFKIKSIKSRYIYVDIAKLEIASADIDAAILNSITGIRRKSC